MGLQWPGLFFFRSCTTIPDLQIISDIPLEIEFYNESDELLTKGAVAICFGCVCFKDRSPAIPMLAVRASRLNLYVFSTSPISYSTYPDSPGFALAAPASSVTPRKRCLDKVLPTLTPTHTMWAKTLAL
ncbi:hypothetical protein V8E54_012263 [Elaphomyces granulatus]